VGGCGKILASFTAAGRDGLELLGFSEKALDQVARLAEVATVFDAVVGPDRTTVAFSASTGASSGF
jgi:hypothetical protein